MPEIKFRAKVETVFDADGFPAYDRVKVPKLTQRHCDMPAFRADRKFGPYANSDLFPGMINRAIRNAGIGTHIRMDRLPESVSVDTSGFLAKVTITI